MSSYEESETINYYNQHAKEFYERTVDEIDEKILTEFMAFLPDDATILDLGCGSGMDSEYFINAGYDVTSVDGSEEMCELAEIHIGQDVLNMKFEEIEFDDVFDGVWASRSLLHVPLNNIKDILYRIKKSLCVGGYVYVSFRYGDFEGMEEGRYFKDYRKHELETVISGVGFKIIKIWITNEDEEKQAMIHVIGKKKK